jgi:recombination protein RecT
MATAAKPASESTAVATVSQKQHRMVALIEGDQARSQIAPFLPEGVDIARVAASVRLAVNNNPQLAQCDEVSLVLAVAKIAQWGLEIGVTAYLVPFNNSKKAIVECVAIAGYNGLCELMIGCGAVRHVEAHAVFAGDYFDYSLGLEPKLEHRRAKHKDRGPVVAAYCVLHLAFGRKVFDVMEVEEIDAIRRQFSKQWKAGPCPDWYAAKSVIRRISKTVPKNPRLAKVLAIIDEDEREEFGEEVASLPAPSQAMLSAPVAPSVAVCAACGEHAVEVEGEMCDGCGEEHSRAAAAQAHALAEAGDPVPPSDGELALDVAPAKPRNRDALRGGR